MSIKIALPLEISGLTLRLKYSTILYSGSTDLAIQFTLDSYWKSLENKEVIFQLGDEFYTTPLLTDDILYYCIIPAEVIAKAGHIRVGVRGGDTICTNMLPIDVYQGAHEYEDELMVPPIDLDEMCWERAQPFIGKPTYLVIDD